MRKISEELVELCEKEYRERKLIVPVGRIDDEEPVYMNFTKISGLFIAGATGTGKSVLIDDIIHSLIYKNKPSEIQFYLIDPKEIELNEYNGLDYVFGKKSEYDIVSINNMISEVQNILLSRKKELDTCGFDSIIEYNKQSGDTWPQIFVIVDEGYDIYNISKNKEIFENILNDGYKVGIHLIFATNAYLKEYADNGFIDMFKYRISFDLASLEQSRLIGIRDSSRLSGSGDAFVKRRDSIKYRFQAMHVPDEEINAVVLYSNKNN